MAKKAEDYEYDPERVVTPGEENAAKGRLAELRTGLTSWCPFFGHLLLKLRVVVTARVPTAAVTPDRFLLINPHFWETLTDNEACGVLCHEVLHPALLYWERRGPRNVMVIGVDATGRPTGKPSMLWNLAHDYALNMLIDDFSASGGGKNTHITLPKGALLDRAKYNECSAEEIYDMLLDEVSQGGKPVTQGWASGDCVPGEGEAGASAEGTGEGPGQSEAQRRENEQFWKQSVVEAAQQHERAKGQGTLPGSIQKLVDSILDPKVYWLDVLSQWVGENGGKQNLSYARPSRRSESVGEILPIVIKEGIADIVVLWDTSGSMNGQERFILSEVSGICDDLSLQVRVICIDCIIHTDTPDVESAITLCEEGLIQGGGGSDFTPAFDKLEEEGFAGIVVAFTDGMIGVPPSKPEQIQACLWVLWHTDRAPTEKWGEVLRVDTEGHVKR